MKKRMVWLTLSLCLILGGCAEEPEVKTGWINEAGGRYYYDDRGTPVTGWLEYEGKHYFFGTDGQLQTGWLEDSGKTYYLTDDGTPITGWQELDGKRCYFRSDGSMVTGWLYMDGIQYYLQPDGSLTTGFVTTDGKTQFFYENGTIFTGYVDADGNPCDPMAEGAIPSRWIDYQDKRYYLQEDGTLRTGWMEDGDKLYYFHEDGTMAVGEVEIEGQTYHFNPHGVRVILVNPWNYLPEGYEVELIQYDDTFSVGEPCYDALIQMMNDCRAAGYEPTLVSGYRTQISQEWLYENRIQRWMDEGYDREEATAKAGTSVAIPGTSEHQLGLAVDLVDDSNHSLTEVQETTPAQIWLMEHCWEYGFILRYPTGASEITGIIYEPWHYRYVGTEISLELRDLGITLEEYLGAAEH